MKIVRLIILANKFIIRNAPLKIRIRDHCSPLLGIPATVILIETIVFHETTDKYIALCSIIEPRECSNDPVISSSRDTSSKTTLHRCFPGIYEFPNVGWNTRPWRRDYSGAFRIEFAWMEIKDFAGMDGMVFIVAPFGFSRCFIFHFPDVSRKGARKCLFVKRRKGGNVRRKVWIECRSDECQGIKREKWNGEVKIDRSLYEKSYSLL